MGSAAARRYSCAAESQRAREPVLGTASTAGAWLLVEEPGPWGPGGVPSSRLGPQTTAALREVAEATSARLLLVRRPQEGRRPHPPERTLFRVRSTRGQEEVLVRTAPVGEVAQAAADDTGWSPHPGRLLLVCTHGRKDWCCAARGRPVAAALAAVAAEATWECSHLGGDRFAATVLDLPSATMHGRVSPADVPELVAALTAGRVLPRLLRGRCTDAMVVQAAEVYARTLLGRDGLDELRPVGARRGADGVTWQVRFRAPGPGGAELVQVLVRSGRREEAQRLTCGAGEAQHARAWELLDVRVQPPAAGPPA